MKVTITITDDQKGSATVDLKFSEPTTKSHTPAAKIGLELLGYIQKRATVGSVESHFSNGNVIKSSPNNKRN